MSTKTYKAEGGWCGCLFLVFFILLLILMSLASIWLGLALITGGV